MLTDTMHPSLTLNIRNCPLHGIKTSRPIWSMPTLRNQGSGEKENISYSKNWMHLSIQSIKSTTTFNARVHLNANLGFLISQKHRLQSGEVEGSFAPSTSPPETGFHRGSRASFWEINTESNLSLHWRSKRCAQMMFDPSGCPPETGFHRGSGGVFCPRQLRRATHWFLRTKTRNWSTQSHPQRHSKAYVYILGNESQIEITWTSTIVSDTIIVINQWKTT